VNYTHAPQFRASSYAPFLINGTEYGEVRQYGNFSFLRIYESGHEVPYYQPLAALEFFRRVLANKAVSDGVSGVTGTYEAGDGTGAGDNAQATHTEPYVGVGSTVVGLGATVLYTAPLVSTAGGETGGTIAAATATATKAGTAVGTAMTSSASSGACRRVSVPWRW
jgi:hypothetical protein